MCGRYASFRQSQDIANEFDVVTLSQAAALFEPSWNVAPTTMVRIIVDRPASALEKYSDMVPVEGADSPGQADPDALVRAMQLARWGLVPPWSKSLSVGARMINARSETAATKPSFRKPFASARCIVVADGYYEWHTHADGSKTPHYIYASNGDSLAFAGMFSWWPNHDEPEDSPNRWVLSTTILTADARDGLEEIHDREPVMLSHDLVTDWLDPALTDPEEISHLIARPGPELSWHPVSRAVGSVRNNTPSLIEPIAPPNGGDGHPPAGGSAGESEPLL